MRPLTIGLLREGKVQPDKRVPFTPEQASEIQQRFPNVKILAQHSLSRAFTDEEYEQCGITVQEDVSDCDLLMGVKEVPIDLLVDGKTYLFFSHTIKQQPYNRKLLQSILKKKVRLIDYEAIKDKLGNRLVAFGRYAGIVGAYNGLWAYGKRTDTFALRRAHECFDVNDLKLELRKVKLAPNTKIILTGSGRVGKGAMETLDSAGIRKVTPADFLHHAFNEPVYVQLSSHDYHTRKDGSVFNREEFHSHPELYKSFFLDFIRVSDLLIAGAYWNPKAPVLFTREDMKRKDFKVKVIADITCDIDGSIPSTKQPSTIHDPVYDYNALTDLLEPAYSSLENFTVMAIDNLPCELPRSASEEFGQDLINRVLPLLIHDDVDDIILRATIAENGRLTRSFQYLQKYVDGQ